MFTLATRFPSRTGALTALSADVRALSPLLPLLLLPIGCLA
jgi:hypothetical protein